MVEVWARVSSPDDFGRREITTPCIDPSIAPSTPRMMLKKYYLAILLCAFASYLSWHWIYNNGLPGLATNTAYLRLLAAMRALTPLPRHALRLLTPQRLQRGIMSPPNSRSQSTFTYRLAAASSGKKTPPRQPKHNQDFFLYSSDHLNQNPPYLRSTKRDSGEDAFFAATIAGSNNHVAFGVADGVGGWQDQGVDPSEFSHGLCGYMAGSAHTLEGLESEQTDTLKPQKLLQRAYNAVMANPRIVAGGCTASLATVGRAGNLETANLGDSGYLLFGPGKVSYRSAVQTHAFNTPYQLSKVPARLQAQHAIFGGGSQHFSETPEQADTVSHELKHGDIVLFGTDGVWDNLSAQDTLGIVTKVMEENGYWFKSNNFQGAETLLNATMVSALPARIGESDHDSYLPGLLATAVMREAKVAGLDRRRDGPFAKEVNMRYPQEGWRGGKPDDIAVVVCVAVQDEMPNEASGDAPIKAKL